ncbi:hypothetical protein OEZ86_009276 [Tetradesmus obliquus]|nr:hypothetical protein OEZ86_009276 [Tetradesmus obliquus]
MGTGESYYYQPKAGSSLQEQQQHMQEQRRQQQQQQLYGGSRYAAVILPQAEADEQLASLIEESGSTRPDDDCPSCDMDEDQADQDDAGPAGGPADQADWGSGFGVKSNLDSLMAGQPEDVDAVALVAAQAAALATQQAAEQQQGVVLQVLGRVASLRKGQAVLTASPRAAVTAGAASVRSRLLITEVSLYTNRAANSQMALDQSNVLIGKMAIPDNIKYMPVVPDSFLFKAGAAWQFPAFVICLGSSYLQRMLARLPQLAEAVLACPGFEEYAAYLPELPHEMPPRLSGPEAVATLATLRSVQFTCLFLATKVADQVHALGLLRFMLTNLSHNGAVVTLQQAANVEARCLEALEWRLGPFFSEDELSGDDEALWAECMGHWDYGTHGDHYPETF